MLTEVEKAQLQLEIDSLSQIEMAELTRFAPPGHPIFNSENGLHKYFLEKFKEKGGMTPEISKLIGWNL